MIKINEDYTQTMCIPTDHEKKDVQKFQKFGIKLYEKLRTKGTHCLYTFVKPEVRK